MMCGSDRTNTDAPGRQADQSHALDPVMSWVTHFLFVAVLPIRLGLGGAPLWFFIAYAVAAGCVLVLIESLAFARDIFFRPEVHAYVLVRIMTVVIGGLVAFTIGHALW